MIDSKGIEQNSYTENDRIKLLFAVAEQLKIPLMQIARTSELERTMKSDNGYKEIEGIADAALQLLDSFMLSMRLHEYGDKLALQPVSLSALLHDVAHKMQRTSDLVGCDVELHIGGKYGPIMAHPAGLQAALLNLGNVFVDTVSQRTSNKRQVIKVAAHRTRYGITAGLFSDIDGLNADMLSRAKKIYGSARQPLSQFTSNNGAGVFVADSLLETMSSGLRIAHHQKLTGMAATFTPSHQMALV